MVYNPIDYTSTYAPVSGSQFAGTTSPEYSAANQKTALDAYAQSLQPFYQQAYQNVGSGAAGRSLSSNFLRSGRTQLEGQRMGQLAGQASQLQQQGMAANQQERQYQQTSATNQAQYKSTEDRLIAQFKDQQSQFAAQLAQQGDMSDEQKKEWWAKFDAEQKNQAQQMGISEAQLTGEYSSGGTWTPGTTDAQGNYVTGHMSGGTTKTPTWQKQSTLAQLIASGNIGSYDSSGNYTNPYASDSFLGGINPTNLEERKTAGKYGMTPYELSLYQAGNPTGFQNLFSGTNGNSPSQPIGTSIETSDGTNAPSSTGTWTKTEVPHYNYGFYSGSTYKWQRTA